MGSKRASHSILLWLTLAASAAAQVITTVAGTTFTFPNSPLPASKAPLSTSIGDLAVDSHDNIYLGDTSNNLVVRVSPAGILTVVAGNGTLGTSGDGGPATSAALVLPTGVAVDASGTVFLLEQDRLRRVLGGTITSALSVAAYQAHHIAVDHNGDVYLVDGVHNLVVKDSNGTVTTVAGNGKQEFSGDGLPATSAGLSNPSQITIDAAGNLYIADAGNNRIRKVSNGIITTVAGSGTAGFFGDNQSALNAGLSFPSGIAVDGAGNLYIADQSNNRIRKVSNGVITTIAGNGTQGFSGDGGSALNAALTVESVAVDSAGNVFFSSSAYGRIREISGGKIATFAGNGGYKFAGDGGPAITAALSYPGGIAIDSARNLYIADSGNRRLRKISGGIITTLVGDGTFTSAGDGGPAISATIGTLYGVAVDSTGNIFIADESASKIREISGGIITTVAGNGFQGSTGDGGLATSAELYNPHGIAVDSSGNLYIAEQNRIRKVSNGIITTVAGNGTDGFSGDNGPALNASLFLPQGVAVDSAGNIYIADTANLRVRKISGGIITTVAGNGILGIAGDGGPAINANIAGASSVAVDSAGNLFIAEGFRIRKVVNGIITTVAGTASNSGFSGDGGSPTSAFINNPGGIAIDGQGNLFIADTGNDRIREVLTSAGTFQISKSQLTFSGVAGSSAPAAQTVSLSSSIPGLPFTATASTTWLNVAPSTGTMPASLQVTADPSQLTAGTYSAVVTISAPNASPSVQTIAVSFTVTGAQPGRLVVNSASLSFSFPQGASPGTQQLTLSNQGSAAVNFSATASTATGGNWLGIAPTSGTVTAGGPVTLTITATPGTLAAGTYSGTVVVTSTGQQIAVPVSLAISPPAQNILLSQIGFSFMAVAQGGTVPSQRLGILNTGSGTLNYNVKTITQPGTSGWLNVSANSGAVIRPFLDVSFIDVSVDARSLAPGAYYGQVQVSATGASNSPQTAIVVLTVLPAGSTPSPVVRPTGLVFTGVSGADNPSSQDVIVTNLTAKGITSGSSITYVGTKGWLKYLPSDFTVQPNAPVRIVVQPDFSVLTAGQYRAYLTLGFDDGSSSVVNILAVVAPAGTSVSSTKERFATGCAATKLLPQFTQVGFSSNATVGFPQSVEVKVVDDCGVAFTDGSVVVSFTNGDPPLSLVSLQDGTWTTDWRPGRVTSTVTLTAVAQSQTLSGAAPSYTVGLQQAAQNPPMLTGAPLGVGTLAPDKFAPGDLILIRGTSIADGPATGLQQQLAGASLLIGGQNASLLYVDTGQVIGLIPFGLPVNTSQQVIVQRDNAYGTPVGVNIAATHPVILAKDGSGQGQAFIYKSGVLADSTNPVRPGDAIVIYSTGLGPTDDSGAVANMPAVSIGGVPATVTFAGTARAQDYPAAGAPTLLGVVSSGLGGLYQINATVPTGIPNGTISVSLTSASQASQPGTSLVVTGGSATIAPSILTINTAGGFPDIAQNTFIEIKGSNLASTSIGSAGLIWDTSAIKITDQLPTQTGGVSVTVNGKPAFVYFASATQLNVLTPLDSTLGPVSIVVTANGVSSVPFTATLQSAAPSFLSAGSTRYAAATHADGQLLVGPAALSSPGYTFLPAKPGEVIVIYAVGFGLPTSPLVNGSASQSGSLPALPTIQIGGLPATVQFAGVVSPGLYQLNVVIPVDAAAGDNSLTCLYGGQSSAAGALVAVQR